MDVGKNRKSWLVAAAVVALLWALTTVILLSSLKGNDGRLAYLLDDTYIHMAMAKNLSEHGVWGVTRHEFSSSSSSLLWTAMIALLYKIFGVNEWAPLLLSLLSATGLILFIFFYFRDRTNWSGGYLAGVCLAFFIALPMPYLIFSGLEHGLQILVDSIFLLTAAAWLSGDDSPREGAAPGSKRRIGFLYLLAALAVLVRFEGLFLAAAVALLFLLQRAIARAILLVAAASAPAVLYGILSVSKGWYFLPNSIYLKGSRPPLADLAGWWDFIHAGVRQLIYNIHIFFPALLILFMVYLRENASETAWKKRGTIAAMIFFPALAAHMLLARSGFFLNYYYQIRYDAYLAALVLLVLLLVAHEARPAIRSWRWPAKAALVLLVLLVSQPVLERGVRASAKVAAATRTTHTYQVQMGRFLNRYFTGKTVVLNDIGAANFFADIRCLDILALCSRDVAKVILNDRYTSEVIAQLAVEAGAEIAVVNDDFLHGAGGIPAGWIPVGRWFITNNVISRENVLSFYVLDESNRAALTAALKDYAPEIPGEVRQVLENTR